MRARHLIGLVAAAALAAPAAALAAPPLERDPHATHGDGAHAAGGHDDHGGGHADPSRSFNWFRGIDLSYKRLDQHGGPLGDDRVGADGPPGHEEPMSVPFVLVLINFGILLVVIGWKGGPFFRKIAERRSDEIKGALDEAARLRAQAQAKLEEYSSRLRAAESEIDQLIEGMRKDAEAEKQRIIAAAEAQAAALKKDAEERIAAEIVRARLALQREVVAAATALAERALRERTTAADHARLVDGFITDIAAARRPEAS